MGAAVLGRQRSAPALPIAGTAERVAARGALARALLGVSGGLSVLGVITFALHRDLLAPFPGITPFAFNVALGLGLLTLAVTLDGRGASRAAAGGAMLIGGATLFQWVSGTSLGIDQLIFDAYRAHSASGHPGRMTPNTASLLVVIGAAVLLRGRASVALALAAVLFAGVAALGYTDPHARALASIGQSVTMALPTALGLCSVALALVLSREHAFFARRSAGGRLVRRLLPPIVIVPVVGSGLLLQAIEHHVVSVPVGIWLLTVGSMLSALAVALWTARVAEREERRAQAGASLRAETAANLTEGLIVRRERDGQVIAANPALEQMFGYASGEITGTDRLLLTPLNEALAHQTLSESGVWTQEAEAQRADGSTFWCSVKASAFEHAEHGTVRVTLYHDVTERRALEDRRVRAEHERGLALQELQRSNKELEQFAHVASHDLSEPLRVIGGFVGLLQRRYEGRLDDDADRFIGATVSGVERMQALIDALLAYSRVGSGELRTQPVELAEAASQALAVLGPRIEETGAQVTVGDLPPVTGDPVLLERVFQNLISNALKFCGEHAPRVEVESSEHEDGWLVRVTDHGIGIEPEHAERVFGMFQRLQGREMPGTGIGLSITRRIVERHGGRIWVEQGADHGTAFCFTMPPRDA